MRLRHKTLTLLSCVTLATAALGCDGQLPADAPASTQSASHTTASNDAAEDTLQILATLLETERVANLRYVGVRDGHILLASTLTDDVAEVFNFPSELVDGPVLDVLEGEGEVLGTVTPGPRSGELRMAADVDGVVDASPREVSERLLASAAPTLCGEVRARAMVALTLGATTLPATANYVPMMKIVDGKGGSVISAVECLVQKNWWTGGDCADAGSVCTTIATRAKRILREGCRGGSSGGSVGGGVGVGVGLKPGKKPGVGVDIEVEAQKTYKVYWWEKNTSEVEERAFVGECVFTDHLWPARNDCTCKLSQETKLAVTDWVNEELPSTECTQVACTPDGAPSCGG